MAYPVRASRMTISVGDMALSFRLCRSDGRWDVDVEAEHVARVPGPLDGAEPGEGGFVEGQARVGGAPVRDGGEVVQHPPAAPGPQLPVQLGLLAGRTGEARSGIGRGEHGVLGVAVTDRVAAGG